MDINNKTLSVFLLGAIVITLGGTIYMLRDIQSHELSTWFASLSGFGNVTLNVQSSLSISTADSNLVNFGTCVTYSGVLGVINSEKLFNTTAMCAGYTANNISVRNDGNVPANVSIRVNKTGAAQAGTFLSSVSASSAIAYRSDKVGNTAKGYTNGCVGVATNPLYINFSSTLTNYTGCSNLTSGATANTFIINFQIIVPYDAPIGQYDDMITLQATNGWYQLI